MVGEAQSGALRWDQFRGSTRTYDPYVSAASIPDPNEGVEVSDYVKGVLGGTASLTSSVAWLAAKGVGADEVAGNILDFGSMAVDYWHNSMTPEARDAISREIIRRDETTGDYEWGDPTFHTVGLMGAESLFGTAAGMGTGAGLTKVMQLFANPFGRKALTTAVEAGVKPGATAAAVQTGEAAIKKLRLVDMVLGAGGFGAGEGAISGVATTRSVYEQVMELPVDKLLQNDRYRQVYESAEELPDLERHQYAADTVAMESGTQAGWQSGLTVSLLGAPMGAYFGRLLGGARLSSTLPRAIGTAAAGEAGQEFFQSGAEQMFSNIALQQFEPDLDTWEGVLNAAAGGALAGALLGAGTGPASVGGAKAEIEGKERQARRESLNRVGGDLKAAAESAANAGVSRKQLSGTLGEVFGGRVEPGAGIIEIKRMERSARLGEPIKPPERAPAPQATPQPETKPAKKPVVEPQPQATPRPRVVRPAPEPVVAAPIDLKAATEQIAARPAGAQRESFAGNLPVNTTYQLTEASDLIASHTPEGKEIPQYPTALQPRDRTRSASYEWLLDKAANFRPELLTEGPGLAEGAPMISPEGVVESGNGRVMLLNHLYQSKPAAAEQYRAYLRENAESFGMTAEQVDELKQPVLVRTRQDAMTGQQLVDVTQAANVTETAKLSPSEQAMVDAGNLGEEELAQFNPDEAGNVLAASNDAFVRSFLGRMSASERGDMMLATGQPNKQFTDRVKAAIFAKAYDDDRMLALMAEEADPDVKNIVTALTIAAPSFARARSSGELGQLDVVNPLLDAIEHLRQARGKGVAVSEYLNQGGLFADIDPLTASLTTFLDKNIRSGRRMGEALKQMGQFIEKEIDSRRNASLFGHERETDLSDVIAAADRYMTAQYGEEAAVGTADIFAQPAPVEEPVVQPEPAPVEPEPEPAVEAVETVQEGEPVRRGSIGMKLATGETVLTVTDRETSPYPRIDLTTNRRASNTVKRVEKWLMQNALDEAKARGDEFNALGFEANLERPQQADKDGAELYLFGDAVATKPAAKAPVTPELTPEPVAEVVEEPASRSAWFAPETEDGRRAAELEIQRDDSAVFPVPPKRYHAAKVIGEVLTPEQGAARLEEWREEARRIGRDEDHSSEVVISLFDSHGVWSKPFIEAGYDVRRHDILGVDDLAGLDLTSDIIDILEGGKRVVGVIAAFPYLPISPSGTSWQGPATWVSESFDSPAEFSRALVEATKDVVAWTQPDFHVIGNPSARIAKIAELPEPTLTFDPHNYGDPYSGANNLWGAFNPRLPTANVKPTKEVLKYRPPLAGPEGFAYSFFIANSSSPMRQDSDETTAPTTFASAGAAPGQQSLLGPPAELVPEEVTALPGDRPDVGTMTIEDIEAELEEFEKLRTRLVDRDIEERIVPDLATPGARYEYGTRENELRVRDLGQRAGEIRKASQAAKPVESIQDVGEKIGGARKDTAVSGFKRGSGDGVPGWRKRYKVAQEIKGHRGAINIMDLAGEGERAGEPQGTGFWQIIDTKAGRFGRVVKKGGFATPEEAEDAIPLVEVARRHSVGVTRGERTYEVYRRVTDRKRIPVRTGFDTRDDAMMYLAENAIDIIDWRPPFPERPHLERLERYGPEQRKGNMTPEKFMETFGFRGAEFGNWLAQDERQEVLNQAFDSLMDMANTLQVPPRSLSLNGELGIGFGSRGRGLSTAAAHYEPGKVVINLTRIKGAGSLAHEWFHAFDNYLARQDTKASDEITDATGKVRKKRERSAARLKQDSYVSHGFSYESRTKVREELRKSFDRVMKTIKRREKEFDLNVDLLGKRATKYTEQLATEIDAIIESLSKPRDAKYYKRFNKPATPEQMKKLRRIATDIKAMRLGKETYVQGKGWRGRNSHKRVEDLSVIYKKVRGRAGFAEHDVLTKLLGTISGSQRATESLESAKKVNVETRTVSSDYYSEAAKIDRARVDAYWSTPHELGARAFESYVYDRLEELEFRSDYLVHSVTNDLYRPGMNPYPEGEERTAINESFAALFQTIKAAAPDEQGNVKLYSRAGKRGKPLADTIISERVMVEETSEVVEIEADAATLLRQTDKRIGTMERLRECLRA